MNVATMLTNPAAWADAALALLADVSLRCGGLLAVAAAATLLMRHASAARRHLVWALAVAGAFALPALTVLAPSWSVPVPVPLPALRLAPAAAVPARSAETAGSTAELVHSARARHPAWSGMETQAVASGYVRVDGLPEEPGGLPEETVHAWTRSGAFISTRSPIETSLASSRSAAVSPSGGAVSPSGGVAEVSAGAAALSAAAAALSAAAAGSGDLPGSRAAGGPLGVWLFCVWLLGAALGLGHLIVGHLRLARFRAGAQRVEGCRLATANRRLAARLGLTHPPTLLLGDDTVVPMTWGVFRPLILLPAGAESWSAGRLETVLIHELAHVRRRDYLTQLIAHTVRAIHWFDPLAWIAVRRLRLEREQACDDAVLEAGHEATDYAQRLLSLARVLGPARLPAAAAFSSRSSSQLARRLRAILDCRRRRGGNTRAGVLATASAALAVLVTLAMVQPLRSQERPPPPPPPTDALPVAPVQDARPTEPVQDVRPTEPIPDARPTEPIPDARPTEPVQDARPTERVQDALPAVDADAPPPPPPMDTQKPADERPPRQDEDRPTPAGRSSPGAPPIGGAAEAGNPVVSLVSMRAGPTAASGPCEEDGKQSMSVNVDDDRLEVRWSNENCSIRVSARGDIEFTPDFRAIKSMSSGSRFQFEERQGTERRELEIQSRDGQLEYRWRVDGRDRPYDTAAREWFADMLVLFFRVTGYQAEERATWILAQQGAGGLLAEAERIRSDYGQRKYLLVLLEKGDPDDDMVSQVIQLAGRDIGSDHELGKLLEASTENRTLSGSNRRAYIEATRSMGSDHQQSQTLAHLMATERLDEAELRLLLNAALAIGSDHDAAELLIAVNENIDDLDRETRDAFLATAGTIGSDHQLYRVLSALAERPDLSNGDLTALLDASAEIGSDHQQAALLIEIADSHSLQGASRDAYLRAVDMIGSSHQRDQARKALLASG